MAWYATQRVDDAIDLTRGLLEPFEAGTWLRLAVVMFFVGGGTGFSIPSFNTGEPPTDPNLSPDLTGTAIAIIVVLVVLAFLLAILLAILGGIMEYVFVETLRTGEISLRAYARRYLRAGLGLFAFRLAIILLGLVVFGGPVALVAGGSFLTESAALVGVGFLVLLLLSPLFVVLIIAFGLVQGFTTNFVVPVSIAEGVNVLDGWRRFWPTLTDQWKQYAVYVIVKFGLELVVGVVALVVLLGIGIVLAIPFGIVGLPLVAVGLSAHGGTAAILLGIAVSLLVVYGLVMFVAGLLVQVPLRTVLRMYVLLVLGDTEERFDLVGDRRPALEN
ncbi:MAG: DUF7544 domain-containing protein [Halococcoides sp.]